MRETGWTWDYVRSLPMTRLWKILAAFGRLRETQDDDGEED